MPKRLNQKLHHWLLQISARLNPLQSGNRLGPIWNVLSGHMSTEKTNQLVTTESIQGQDPYYSFYDYVLRKMPFGYLNLCSFSSQNKIWKLLEMGQEFAIFLRGFFLFCGNHLIYWKICITQSHNLVFLT